MIPLPWGRIALIAAIALAGAAAGWTVQDWRLGAKLGPLQAEVSRLQARATILESANAQCAQSVKTQNEAVNGLLEAGEKREQRAKEAARRATIESAGLATDIAGLRAAPRPPDPACAVQAAAAAKLIADEIRGRK